MVDIRFRGIKFIKYCSVCMKEITVMFKERNRKNCSLRCSWLARGGAEYNARIGRENRLKISESNRSSANDQGRSYRKYLGRHEHRVVAEKMIGRALRPGEIVHHIDGNIRNNHPDNLEVLASQSAHIKKHLPEMHERFRQNLMEKA